MNDWSTTHSTHPTTTLAGGGSLAGRPPLRINLPSRGGLTAAQRSRHAHRSNADLATAARLLDRLREDPPIRTTRVERLRGQLIAGGEPRLDEAAWEVLLGNLAEDLG